MSDHEFEKQVQLKMEQFRLRPSNAVWTEVEKNIRRDKRRRRMIMWLPIALLFLGAGGYFAIKETAGPAKHVVSHATSSSTVIPSSTQNDQPSTSSSTQQTQENTLPATTPAANTATTPNTPISNTPVNTDKVGTDKATAADPVATRPVIGKTTPSVANTNSKAPTAVEDLPGTTKATIKKITGNTPASTAPKTIKDNKLTKSDYEVPAARSTKNRPGKAKKDNDNNDVVAVDPSVGNKPPVEEKQLPVQQQDSSIAITTDNKDSAQTVQDVATVDPAIPAVDSNSLAQVTAVDSVAKDSAQTIAGVPPVATPEVAQAAKVQKKAGPSNWQFGIQVEGGYSGVTKDGLFGFLEKNYTQVPDLALPSFNNSLTYTPQFPRPVNRPSNITMGLSFSVGGFVKRALSNRLSLSAGLQYTYLSTRQVVGSKVNNNRTVNRAPSTSQVVNEYYNANTYANFNPGNNTTQNYTNRYQFIELPVTLHTQLNRGKRLPIIWDAGFSVSKLLNTNALHYDGLGGVYYQDKALFNKTQWAIATGFNVQLFKHTQHPLTVGPVMRYNITPMLKKEYSTGQHVWAVGLRASVLLKK